jgi:hypothetical protein
MFFYSFASAPFMADATTDAAFQENLPEKVGRMSE